MLVEHFHCRSDPRLKEMLAKFNIYVENVGGGSVSFLKKKWNHEVFLFFFEISKIIRM